MQWTTIMIALGVLSTQAFGAAIESPSSLTKRSFDYSSYHCWGSRDATRHVTRDQNGELRDGIEYLRGIGGTPKESPKTCGRVSCSYGTAIYWCNNNDETHSLRSFATIADGAEFLLDKCGGDGSPFGEVYTDNNWGVRVVADAC